MVIHQRISVGEVARVPLGNQAAGGNRISSRGDRKHPIYRLLTYDHRKALGAEFGDDLPDFLNNRWGRTDRGFVEQQ